MTDDVETATAREIFGAVEALSEGLAIFDSEDALVLCNGRFKEMHPGLDTLLQGGLPWPIFLAEARRHRMAQGLDQLDLHLQSGSGAPLELEAPRPAGRWVRMGLAPTPSGGFVLTAADITEAYEAAELRAEADGLLRQVLDACSANLMMTRIADGEILYRNPASEALFGRQKSARDVFEDENRRPDMLAELLATGQIDDFECNLLRADRSDFPARVSARLVDYGGEDVIVSSATDMTQLYAQRDELARQREASFQNEKLTALGELLAGVAHELNNPLSVVVGQSLMLREETADTELSRRVEKISQSAERCAKIVKTFLAMARQKPARLAPVSLNTILETAVDVAGYGLRSSGGSIEIALSEDLPPVKADEDQIAQVVVNLLINAEQAVKEQGSAATVTMRTFADPKGDAVIAEIADNGPGIPAGLRARIFEPFFTTKKSGAGVGLALCHRIVAGHSGSLTVDEAPGGGAAFRLSLPRATESPTKAAPTDDVAPSLSALVVEDEADVADMLSDMLGILGVTATVVTSAEAGIERLTTGPRPDVILSDLRMPGMGGEGLLRVLKQRWPTLVPRMAFVTGDSMTKDTRALGRPILEKPVIPHELRALLRTLIQQDPIK